MENDKPVIQTRRLTKIYGKNAGITDINLSVKQGEIFGFLGPNGSGKTTTINLFLDLVRPTGGDVRIFGMDARRDGMKIRKRIGYIPAEPGLYEEMTGMEYLLFYSGLKGKNCRNRIKELAELFFQVKLERKIKAYSRGMRQILYIIQAFMGEPDLYILDEPATNLDPLMNIRFNELLESERKNGKTIFLSSHILGEVERLCDRVCIIRNGRIAALESVETLREKMTKTVYVAFENPPGTEELMVEGVQSVREENGKYIIDITGEINPVLQKISMHKIKTFDFHKMTLEEIFRKYFEKNSQ
ncbi:MAG: ABC transporter ATP-binding protein [Firmicutes bacterium]|nr:ABC transporter ATP-binding protein [Bacillota bacterium]